MPNAEAGRNSKWLLLCLVIVFFTEDTGASELRLAISVHHRIGHENHVFLYGLAGRQYFYQCGSGNTSREKKTVVVYRSGSDQVHVLRAGSCSHSVQGSASTGSGGNEPPERPSDYSRHEPYDYPEHQSSVRRWLLRLFSFLFRLCGRDYFTGNSGEAEAIRLISEDDDSDPYSEACENALENYAYELDSLTKGRVMDILTQHSNIVVKVSEFGQLIRHYIESGSLSRAAIEQLEAEHSELRLEESALGIRLEALLRGYCKERQDNLER